MKKKKKTNEKGEATPEIPGVEGGGLRPVKDHPDPISSYNSITQNLNTRCCSVNGTDITKCMF